LLCGRIVDARGYPFLFACLGVFALSSSAAGLLMEDRNVKPQIAIAVASPF